nr:piggyBac transposable element-derived protein 4-like [Onthophagus taurus]
MYSYEEEQKRLTKLWQEVLSDEDEHYSSQDEESLFGDVYLSDEYQCESSVDFESSSKRTSSKLRKKKHKKHPPKNGEKRQKHPITGSEPSTSATGTETSNNVSTEAQHVADVIEIVIANMTQDSDSDSDETLLPSTTDAATQNTNITWGPVTGNNLRQIMFSEANTMGFDPQIHENFHDKTPCEFYSLFVNDDILELMVVETNRYGAQCLAKNQLRRARITSWHDTTVPEMKKFLGIVLWMGLCQFPTLQAYWSKSPIYKNFITGVMSRNRFQLLSKMLHFSDNSEVTEDRLQKLTPLVLKLKEVFQRIYVPGEYVCIDETLVPFQGRLKFKQYIANKRHKFGIKVFKLCLESGYTYDFKIYCGKEQTEGGGVPTNVVLNLMKDLLHKGRTLCTDNYYTSVTLAHELLRRETHLIGTLRTNRKFNPKNVITKKLKLGETIAEESNSGIVVQKWKDKRDVLTLSTKYTDEMVTVQRRRGEVCKPKNVIEYNKFKAFIDIADQKKSYNSSLRKTLKWYKKLAIELLTGTAFINAYIAYRDIANEPMSITKFRESVIFGLLQLEEHE